MGSALPNETLNFEHRKLFPKPAAPVSPVLSFRSFSFKKETKQPAILNSRNKLFVTSGRAAIVLALKHAGIKPDDQVLVPAYHCESMVSPVRHLGAIPVFYKINKDTSVNIESCNALLNSKTRAIIVTHYFGFPQELKTIRDYCDRKGLIMIEDCAHCLFGSSNGQDIGSFGDYAIASTMKFFPVFDGGILASNSRNLDEIKLDYPTSSFGVKAAVTIIERAANYRRLSIVGAIVRLLAKLKDNLWRHIKTARGKSETTSTIPASAEGGFGLSPEWISIRASKASKFIIKNCSKQRIVSLRRHNFHIYSEALASTSGCQSLNDLTERDVPLVFAIHFDNPELIFNRLKLEAVPIWRFGEFLDAEVTEQTCPVSFDYSRSILQFPCHQEMLPTEIEWIIERIKAACAAINNNNSTDN